MVRWTEIRDRILALIPPKEKLLYSAIVGLVLCVCGWAGGNYLRRPAAIVIRPGVASSTRVTPSAEPAKSSPPVGGEVVVHVVGAVVRPGVVHLAAGSRVEDAIREAGGAKPAADLDALNLAAKLEDGTQLNIPTKEVVSNPAPVIRAKRESAPQKGSPIYRAAPQVNPSYASKPSAPSSESKETAPGLINLNTATLEQLDSLPGIGPATAKKILDFRKQNGPFRTVDGLLDVRGIGPKKMADIRPLVKV